MNKIRFVKLIDGIVGRVAVRCFPQPSLRAMPVVRRILVIRPGGIGDAVLLIPALLQLKKTFPHVHLAVLAERRNGAIFTLCPAVNQVYLYDNLRSFAAVLATAYDVVIDSEQWHRFSAVVARFLRASCIIGFATNERQRLFTHRIPYSHDTYEQESFSSLISPLGVTVASPNRGSFLEIPADSAARAAELLGDLCGEPFVVIFPGASIPERRWGSDNFRKLACMLHARGMRFVVVGGPDDCAEGDAITAGGLGLQLAGKSSLVETAAIIARAKLLLSGDSGVLHLGVGLGCATISLFGPGIARKWAPQGEIHTVINKCLPCSPCTRFGTTPDCPHNARCIRDITVTEVSDAVLRAWERANETRREDGARKKNGPATK
jgi:ADP-heptose:LPS heptosyltransferase